jgi:hypothetical protein
MRQKTKRCALFQERVLDLPAVTLRCWHSLDLHWGGPGPPLLFSNWLAFHDRAVSLTLGITRGELPPRGFASLKAAMQARCRARLNPDIENNHASVSACLDIESGPEP